MYDLETLGWSPYFEEAFKPYTQAGYQPARVALEYQKIYRVYAQEGEILAEVTGKFRYDAREREDFPAVGDWVALSPQPDQKRAFIHAVLPRKSKFSRKVAGTTTEQQVIATNVDTVFLVQGLDNDYNLRRIERYLVMAWDSGAAPVVILNKADLCSDVKEKIAEVESIALGAPVYAISSKKNTGLEVLNQYLGKGRTVAFLGSSGVGKSTLINRLIGKEVQKTAEVRKGDDRGRHTTTHRELIILPEGGLLIDTPGMRELQLWDIGEGLTDAFEDVEEIAAGCQFSDCRHENEPNCAIKQALAEGTLDSKRLENFTKLKKESEYLDSRQDERLALSRKEKVKRIHKSYRKIKHRGE